VIKSTEMENPTADVIWNDNSVFKLDDPERMSFVNFLYDAIHIYSKIDPGRAVHCWDDHVQLFHGGSAPVIGASAAIMSGKLTVGYLENFKFSVEEAIIEGSILNGKALLRINFSGTWSHPIGDVEPFGKTAVNALSMLIFNVRDGKIKTRRNYGNFSANSDFEATLRKHHYFKIKAMKDIDLVLNPVEKSTFE